MKKEIKIYLEHIIESIDLVQDSIKDMNKDEFCNDIHTQDAVIRRIQVIGQAAKNLPDDLKEDNPDIPWRKIIAMRNILVHDYLGIDLDIVWNTAVRDLVFIKEELKKLLK